MKKWINIVGLVLLFCILLACEMLSVTHEDSNGRNDNQIEDNIAKDNTTEVENEPILNPEGMTILTRVNVPEGYDRIQSESEEDQFADFVRNYPLKEFDEPVLLYNGREKGNQKAHIGVFQLPIENEDLQQCADSVMRMYAEYYWTTEQYDRISFHLSDGFEVSYVKWREGYRVGFENDKPYWYKKAGYDDSYDTFVKYMRIVFAYAGTASMAALETEDTALSDLKVGDVFIKGGSPGHVVMVVDVCENDEGKKAFLIAQGYMPAQEFHVLKNPLHADDPWYYEEEITYPLRTPEYTFEEGSLKRLVY